MYNHKTFRVDGHWMFIPNMKKLIDLNEIAVLATSGWKYGVDKPDNRDEYHIVIRFKGGYQEVIRFGDEHTRDMMFDAIHSILLNQEDNNET